MAVLRNTAYHIRISDILLNDYVKEQGRSYLKFDGKEITRVNIIGMVVAKDNNSARMDDGSALVSLIEFDSSNLERASVGDVVLVVGRIWESDSQRFIVPEIIKKTDRGWMRVRAHELGIRKPEKLPSQKFAETAEKNTLDFIRERDKGSGVGIDVIIREKKIREDDIQGLLKSGEIFLVKPGYVKVLE